MTTNAVATLEPRVLNEGYGPGAWHVVLGITCHAIYHAGQIQLIKRLRGD